MNITVKMLEEKNISEEIKTWFCKYDLNDCDYQIILDHAVEDGQYGYGYTLLNAFGPSDEVIEIDGDYTRSKPVIFCGSLIVKGDIQTSHIFVGGNIFAGGNITCDSIDAGGSIGCGGNINSNGHVLARSYIKAGGDINLPTNCILKGNIKNQYDKMYAILNFLAIAVPIEIDEE